MLVEVRHCEGNLAVVRGIDETLLYQAIAYAGDLSCRLAHLLGDRPTPVRADAQVGHCVHVAPLLGRGAHKPNAKETPVEGTQDIRLRALHHVDADGARVSRVPHSLTPLLKEVWVALSLIQQEVKGIARVLHAMGGRGRLKRPSRITMTQPADASEFEKSLCVALGIAGESRKLEQPRRNNGERKALLVDSMNGGDQGCEISAPKVLDLVEQEQGTGLLGPGDFSYLNEQVS